MTVKSPSAHRHGYPVASSTLTKDRPSGSWLLANNPTLAFSSFLSNGATDRPILSTRPTPSNSSHTDIATKTTMTDPSNTNQRIRRRSTTAEKQPQPQQQPGRSISFNTEFPTLTSMSSPLTPTTADPFTSISSSATHHHVWSNAQRIQHKVKSPAKAPWHDDGSDNDDDDNMMEIERLKALVPRRPSQHQGGIAITSSSSAGVHRRRISATSTSRVTTTGRKRPPPRPWTVNDRTTKATLKQGDDSSSSSSSSSSCSSILSPPPPLSPITTNTSSSTTTEPASSMHLNAVVTKRDQLRFYLFLKKWTGHLVGDSADPNGWQQRQLHSMSRPLPIGTQRYGT